MDRDYIEILKDKSMNAQNDWRRSEGESRTYLCGQIDAYHDCIRLADRFLERDAQRTESDKDELLSILRVLISQLVVKGNYCIPLNDMKKVEAWLGNKL